MELLQNEAPREPANMTFANPNARLSFGEKLANDAAFGTAPFATTAIKTGYDILQHPQDFAKLTGAAFDQTQLVDTLVSKNIALEQAYDQRIKDLKALSGVELENPMRGGYHQEVAAANRNDIRQRLMSADQEPAEPLTSHQIFDRKQREIIANHPDAPELTNITEDAQNISQDAERRLEAARRDTKLGTPASLVAQFVGGAGGQYRDPLFVASLFLGPTTAVGKTVAMRIATSGLSQGFFNAGLAALEQPAVQAWRNQIGTTNGVWPAAENVGMAFLFGLIPGAVLRGVHEGMVAERATIAKVIEGTTSDAEIDKVMALARQVQKDIDRTGAAPAAPGEPSPLPPERVAPAAPEPKPVEERAVQVGREMDAADKVTQPPPLKEVAPAMPARFQTSKGSTYVVHEDGTTTRTKAAREEPGHEGDFGEKARSDRTIFLDSDVLAAQLTAAGLQNLPPEGARVLLRDNTAMLLIWNRERGTWGRSSEAIPYSDTPGVGKAPLEMWGQTDDVLPGHITYKNMHAGNAITEVRPATKAEYAGGMTPELRDQLVTAETRSGEDPINEPTAAAVAEVDKIIDVAVRKRPKRDPEGFSLIQFIADRGGIAADDPLIGDVRAIFGRPNPFIPGFGALIRKTGKSLDNHLEAAMERGNSYLYDPGAISGGPRSTTIADLLDAIGEDNRGNKVYKHGRDPEQVAAAKEKQLREQSDIASERALDEHLADLGMSHVDIDPKVYQRTLEIMRKEGVSDPDAAFERAVMEDTQNAVETGQTPRIEDTIPGWDVPDDAGPTPAPGDPFAPSGLGAEGEAPRNVGSSDPASPVANEIADRIAEAKPRNKREAQMAATEAMEDIARRQSIAKATEELGTPPLPAPVDRKPPTPPMSEEPGGNDPLTMARRGELSADRAKEIAKELQARWTVMENAVLGPDADAWRKAHKASNRFWDAAKDEQAKAQDAIVAAIEAKHPPEVIARLYGDMTEGLERGQGHMDPEGWRNLAKDLRDVEGDRKDAVTTVAYTLRRLPDAGKELTDLDRETLSVIQHALNEETKRGGDPDRFLQDAFKRSAQRYGGGPNAAEIIADDMAKLRALMLNPPEPKPTLPPPPLDPLPAPKGTEPLDAVPVVNDKGQVEFYTPDQAANFGKREDWIADIIGECK